MTGNSGRKKTRAADEIKAAVQAVPQHSRQTLRALPANCGIPETTLIVHMKEHGSLKARYSYVKPMLTADNVQVRNSTSIYDDEEAAARSVKSKNFITKVMFLAAVARPRYDPATKEDLDGKIGILPFVEIIAAKRKSINREKGTPMTVPQNVNGGVYKDFMLQKVVPAVLARFPVGDLRRGVRIQQDNASPHRQSRHSFNWTIA
ncbi:hypothetical protein H257_03443 [Aphanomyces astaci]|uniref:Uncharacterized protein n=1 Tax=Aphanomyces astaci TaxID=112090 RepID=W4GWW1_APHAT|nr:hypothetical protein H257_03443 [Aphanomyces astaci]ETV84157.1 hypothetical protein H257_03443 [Aphanomyces astaci]|eukprot:XP_009825849.1 hypothetical protein H257_03443 [Aphanomyces astaci]